MKDYTMVEISKDSHQTLKELATRLKINLKDVLDFILPIALDNEALVKSQIEKPGEKPGEKEN